MASLQLHEEYVKAHHAAVQADPARSRANQIKQSKKDTWYPSLKKIVEFTDDSGQKRVVEQDKYKRDKKGKVFKAEKDFRDHAIVLRMKIVPHGTHFHLDPRLEINSGLLQDLFKKVALRHKELDLKADPIIISPPYQSLFFLQEVFDKQLADPDVSRPLKQEIRELIDFLLSDSGMQKLQDQYDALIPDGRVNFDLLWTIYPPEELVYYATSTKSGIVEEWCGLVEKWSVSHGSTSRWLRLDLLVGHHDGSDFFITNHSITVDGFRNIEDIDPTSGLYRFPVPLRRMSEAKRASIYERLKKRGMDYVAMSKAPFSFFTYTGPYSMSFEEGEKRLQFAHGGKFTTVRQMIRTTY
jgi:hypothetical protein